MPAAPGAPNPSGTSLVATDGMAWLEAPHASPYLGAIMTKLPALFALFALCGAIVELAADPQPPVTRARTPVRLPDIPGYVTLKGDFHIHTVFSDGLVWPTVRADEAWREGLDAIAITDHIEYQPHKEDVSTNHNRAYDLARGAGADLDLIVVRGSEITRQMPPGHLNAIFLTNSTLLAVTNWHDTIAAAHAQGAFIFWNHPGWSAQTTNGLVLWYPEHTQLLEAGMLHGIEVVNGREYYPEAHRWAIEKKLTLMSNSDIHAPLNLDYHVHDGDHRPLTLVFATDRSPAALKEALFARRTAVYSANRLIGDERFLKPIFEHSVGFTRTNVTLQSTQRILLQLHNASDLDYELERAAESDEVSTPSRLRLPAGKTVLFSVQSKSKTADGTRPVKPSYRVTNLLVGPDQPLEVSLPLQVTFTPAPAK